MKMPFEFSSLRQKLFGGVLLTSLIALLTAGAGLFVYDLKGYRESSATSLAIEAQTLGYMTSAALEFDDRSTARQNLAFLASRPAVRAAAIYGASGSLFARYVRPDVPASELPPVERYDRIDIRAGRIAVVKEVNSNGERIGAVYLAEDLDLPQRITSYALIALSWTVAAMVVAALLSAWLQRSLTRPVIEISQLARRIVDTRDYSLRATRTTHDETGMLVDAFNEMLAEIQRRTSALEASNEEVQRLNRDLERRVRARTAELQDSNVQLQEANLAKSNFLSMMSHEIRTPMNGVLGMLELMSLGELEPGQRTTLQIVRESGRSLVRIIDDILDFSKIEAGKLEIRGEVTSIAQVVANVVGIYAGNASSKALMLRSKIDPALSPAVMIDPLRLQQILNNLVSNAIKFTSKGYVEIEARLVERGAASEVVRLSVRDSGIGISEEQRARLFQPFAQAEGISRIFGGTGLGLSIGQRLAHLMGGTVEIESALGKGTTVSVTLPMPLAAAGASVDTGAPQGGKRSPLSGKRRTAPSAAQAEQEGTLVLAVDDHPVNRMVLMRQVTVLGYAAETAKDGREALASWRSGRFGLVITDCNMPEMDGYELARAIREEEHGSGKPRTIIVACTANALKGEAQNCFDAGMDDYIAKPVELDALAAKLDAWLPLPEQARRSSAGSDVDTVSGDTGSAPILDPNVLAELSEGDAAKAREIVALFLAFNDEDASAMREAMASRDMANIARTAHRIRGATTSIGALALAQVCDAMESAARMKDWNALAAQRSAFDREVHRLKERLESPHS